MTNEKEILKKLLVDEEGILKDLGEFVDKVKNIFVIERSTGKVFFKNFGKLTDPQRIAALLVGRYFAEKLDIINDDSMGVSEIADALGRPKTSLSGPLKDLSTKGYVEKMGNRKYRIAYNRIQNIFEICFEEENYEPKRRTSKN